jgi:hypothetical protein
MEQKPFWRGVFSEPDGTPSFARVATAALVGAAIGWVTYLVHANHALPELAGCAGFITVLYTTNKVAAIWGKVDPPAPPPPPAPPAPPQA